MGLSASQARLLSLTQRINNNELESEMISNAKIHLAARNTIASENYINALDGTKLEYISYDDTGTQEKVSLTFNSINQYTPLKNQYALFNNENQIYVSATDAANFENSANLYQFLDCYGVFDQGREEYNEKMQEYEAQMDEYNKQKDEYDKALAEYNKEMNEYTTNLNEYNEKLAQYEKDYQQYLADKQAYEDALNSPDLYAIFSGAVGVSTDLLAIPSTGTHPPSSVPQSMQCYWSALHPDGTSNRASCYTHVLGYIIDYTEGSSGGTNGPYTTTTGDSVDCSKAGGYMGNTCNAEMAEVSAGINELDDDGNYKRVCDGTDDYRGITGVTNALEKALQDHAAGTISDTELKMWRLISDFVENPDGTFSKKSLKQKAIDMMYLSQNWGYAEGVSAEFPYSMLKPEMMVDILINFTDGDLKNLTLDPPDEPTPPEPFTETPPTMEIAAPQPPEMPEYTDKIYDKPLAQWYTNLWYIMDGNSTSDEIYSVYDEQAEFDYFTVPNVSKTSTQDSNNYVIISDDQAGNQEWLQFAINNGLVTLSQATLKNDTNSTNIRWEGIEYSSTSDIYESQDETKIAKAEAEYQKTLTEIQAEDKQLDIEIKKLDTEHSALEKELESIKGVMQKNTERSFSAFS